MNGIRVKEQRLKKGISLSSLARKAQISKSYLSTIEKNPDVNPSLHILRKIAFALEMKIDDFIKDIEEDHQASKKGMMKNHG